MFIFTFVILLFTFLRVNGHGRLTVPATRNPTGYENSPVPSNSDSTFVCRNPVTTPATTITAGTQLTLKWDFGAAHVGDCAVYISYDWSVAAPNMKFFKIANLYDCKAQNRLDVPISLPDWLPSGRAVLRWDWYALHVFPSIEFYTQCADVVIEAGANPTSVDSIVKYSIVSPAIYPAAGDADVNVSKFRDPWNANQKPQFMTGPNCAKGYTGNNCDLTKPGTQGYIDVGDNTSPVPSPTPPSPTPPSPTPPSPTPPSPTPPSPTPPSPTPPSPTPPSGTKRLVAYLGNWQSCPTLEKVKQYTHILVAFAVTYTWAPNKNVCDTTCTISSPPICNDQPQPALMQQWQDAGVKVILSFGGAGMGGSWAGDQNNCWDYCFGKEQSVISQLDTIVRAQGFDGVDLDYEYFHNTAAQQNFLRTVTTGLKSTLPQGSLVTHAPMDGDVEKGKTYFNIIKETATSIDFITVQYYNGPTRPAIDGIDGTGQGSVSALAHYRDLVDDAFNGDPNKVVFGFCISDCSGTGSNANANQAAAVMTALKQAYPCNGGAFFWVAENDNGSWSKTVGDALAPVCDGPSPTPPSPTPPVPTPPSPTPPSPTPPVPTPPSPTPPVPTPPSPTPPSPTPPSPSPLNSCVVHDVSLGESLSQIATYYTNLGKAVTWQAICDANLLNDCNSVMPGESLLVPCTGCGTWSRDREVRRLLQDGEDSFESVVTVRCDPGSNPGVVSNGRAYSPMNVGSGQPASGGEGSSAMWVAIVGLAGGLLLLGVGMYIVFKRMKRPSGSHSLRSDSSFAGFKVMPPPPPTTTAV